MVTGKLGIRHDMEISKYLIIIKSNLCKYYLSKKQLTFSKEIPFIHLTVYYLNSKYLAYIAYNYI